MTARSKLVATMHAARRLQQRLYPGLTDAQAFALLKRLAQDAKPMKVRVRR